MAWFNVANVGGSRSDLACFLVKSHHLNALTVEMLVLWTKNKQTSFSTAFCDSLFAKSLVPSCGNALIASSLASSPTFQHVDFPLFENEPVLSAPVKAWNRRIRLTCLHPCCHPIQITWWFIWEVTIVQFATRNCVHEGTCKQNNCILPNGIWIGWQQGCKHVSRIRLCR